MNSSNRFFFLILFLIFSFNLAFAADISTSLVRIQEENQRAASEFLQNASIFVAFIAGITSILSPCILPLFPAYFAVTFKQKKKITLATLVFFLGFSLMFMTMGLIATATGGALSTLFKERTWVIPFAGAMFIVLGFMTMLGGGFSGLVIRKKLNNDFVGLFLSGVLFAIGWSACTGPLLAGVLIMTATFQNYATALWLMFGYSLGIFVPLFLLSFFYDRSRLSRLDWLNREVVINLGKTFYTSLSKIVAGIMFLAIGLFFIFFEGTSVINSFDMFGLRQYFYDIQNAALRNSTTASYIGAAVLVLFIFLLAWVLIREARRK